MAQSGFARIFKAELELVAAAGFTDLRNASCLLSQRLVIGLYLSWTVYFMDHVLEKKSMKRRWGPSARWEIEVWAGQF